MLEKTGELKIDGYVDKESPTLGCRSDLSSIEAAIVATVTYRDLFDYPVTATEIHRYLQHEHCTRTEVEAALRDRIFNAKYLAADGEFFALPGREKLFDLRRRRQENAAPLWRKARGFGEILASLPFVKMVAVTGSLAVDNPGRDADIDFMLVTDGGRMWTVRALAKVLQMIDVRFGRGELCVNHLISTRALALDQPGLYVAQEATQMVPLFGLDVYAELRSQNPWIDKLLPNAEGATPVNYTARIRWPRTRKMFEYVLRGPVGDAFEIWERRRKMLKYNETSFLLGRSTPFRAEATGHRKTAKDCIDAAFADRLKRPRQRNGSLRVLFGQGYHLKRDPKLFKTMQPFPPLGTLYAAGVARSLGYDIRVHDSMLAHSISEWTAALQVNDPDVVILYEDNFNYLTKMCLLEMRDAALEMAGIAKARGATVLACSSDSADEPELYLRAGVDVVLVGEGEETLAEVLNWLADSSRKVRHDIVGIAFLDDAGKLCKTGKRAVIRGLDDLPLPAWDLIDLDRYADIWRRRHGHAAINMVTTRGCPYHCNWCAKPIWGQRYNARSPEHVVDELEHLGALINFDYVWFMDDIFGLKPMWIKRFATLLNARNIQLRFKCLSRPDILLREGEAAALAAAGCDVVWLGAESGSQNILDAMEKGTTVEMIESASASLREHGVNVGLFIQFGYPGETQKDIRKTIAMIRRIMPEQLGVSVSYPLPGTRFHERVESELGKTRHWRDSDDLAMLFRGPFNTGYYRALHRYVHSDLSLRKVLRRPRSARNILAISYHVIRRTVATIAMAIFSRMPHKGLGSLAAELDAAAAATPSEQSVE